MPRLCAYIKTCCTTCHRRRALIRGASLDLNAVTRRARAGSPSGLEAANEENGRQFECSNMNWRATVRTFSRHMIRGGRLAFSWAATQRLVFFWGVRPRGMVGCLRSLVR